MDKGKVEKIISKNRALISVLETGDCESCGGKSFCKISGKDGDFIEVVFKDDVKKGDEVDINVEPKNRIIVSALVFLLPLVFMFISYFIGVYFFKKESIGAIVSIAGFAGSFGIIILILKAYNNNDKFIPLITKIKSS